jgi:hypothetical protein
MIFEALPHLATVAEEVAADQGRSSLRIIVVNKDTDENRELSAAFKPGELAAEIREALRRVAQVEALVQLGREIVAREVE